MKQNPSAGDFLLKWRGDKLSVTLTLDSPRSGRAAFRTNIGHAKVRRREIIAESERGETPMAKAWTDIPLPETAPGVFHADIPLNEVGIFSGKTCFFPEGSSVPEWPDGANTHIKVESAETRRGNSIYTVFPRQFGSFREIVRRLPLVMDTMGFKIIQTLPPFPVPTTYAVMGEYGCPFAALDFFSVDPAMAEFDEYATPMDQFLELIDAVHARRGLFFVDLPANHTGWASTLQTHHPEWFHREKDGRFVSPGAWGVKWADLVELDYSNSELRSYMADVFLFWCRNGVDGFRCDAGYMIPAPTWEYIVARVREEYPDTVFMLEGLGGDLRVTDRLLCESNLDWAYSELFQTYDRAAFDWYLPGALERSEKFGTLVHFAETHDNDRLAKGGETYARLRVKLAALLSGQGAWGIANGVEWFCKEKIDVHGKNDLNWGAKDNMVEMISRLNFLLSTHPAFEGASHQELITGGEGNTLAVVREYIGGRLLVLANLDCGKKALAEWDKRRFPECEAFDLLAEKKIKLKSPFSLAPGEVLCVEPMRIHSTTAKNVLSAAGGENATTPLHKTLFHWVYPRDVNREVVVPENEWFEISAPSHFRVRLIDPTTGKTLRVSRSHFCSGRHAVEFEAPHYKGDGTKCRRLKLLMIFYDGGKSKRTESVCLIPPRSHMAKVELSLPGDKVRIHPEWRTILSNGAGAASQMRIGWASIASQYDAILAANTNPNCPSDRLNLWTRTRCWLQREGYTHEFDRRCVTRFSADPAGRFAEWQFMMPCGMGKATAWTFAVTLIPGENAAKLVVRRDDAGEDDVREQVRIVFRPDIEWRSFHSTTKAYKGLDGLFPEKTTPTLNGFIFAPYKDKFVFEINGGEYHHEPQWEYNVAHPEEAERGQDPSGDLFSPGWISADIKIGGSVTLFGALNPKKGISPASDEDVAKDTEQTLAMEDAMSRAINLFIVKRDELKTVIAGYPWFLDWGRDTFIFMRSMIAEGRLADSIKILRAFAAFEENGTLPNIIYGDTAGNRDTSDAQLWFIRCVREAEEKLSKTKDGFESERKAIAGLKKTCDALIGNYVKGTPNGIKVDEGSGLVWSPSHFTWMDTNYPACTPRCGYPVEIQALWISALKYMKRDELADRALASLEKHFKRADGIGYRDCLNAPHGESAADATPDDAIRPNQLLLITLGVLDDPSIVAATEELVLPGAIRSLNSANAAYRGAYTGDEDTSRKQAYHNGTGWGWQFPLYAEAILKLHLASPEVVRQLLASAVDALNSGCLCHLSEIADGDAPHAQKGCTAQGWSDSELLRVWMIAEEAQ